MLVQSLVPAPSLRYYLASAQGARQTNADAAVSFVNPLTQEVVFALADGIGDNDAAAGAARVAASVAARAPADEGPVSALRAAQVAVRARSEGDCVLVVALPGTGAGGRGYRIGWVGDVRAYAWDGTRLQQLTTDHTLAQYFRNRGEPTTRRMEHIVTTTVRTVRPADIGTTQLPGTSTLVLTSDGVHKVLDPAAMHAILARQPPQPAGALVESAILRGGTDNATALVVPSSAQAGTLEGASAGVTAA